MNTLLFIHILRSFQAAHAQCNSTLSIHAWPSVAATASVVVCILERAIVCLALAQITTHTTLYALIGTLGRQYVAACFPTLSLVYRVSLLLTQSLWKCRQNMTIYVIVYNSQQSHFTLSQYSLTRWALNGGSHSFSSSSISAWIILRFFPFPHFRWLLCTHILSICLTFFCYRSLANAIERQCTRRNSLYIYNIMRVCILYAFGDPILEHRAAKRHYLNIIWATMGRTNDGL